MSASQISAQSPAEDVELDCFGDETSELQRRWQLYGGADGVEAAEAIEQSYQVALWEFEKFPIKACAVAMWQRVTATMSRRESAGASDSEPLWYLADRISEDLSKRHGVKVEVSRWTGGAV